MRRKQDKRVWITIDTEMDADIHWKKSWPPEYSSVCEGIPQILRPIWERYQVYPIYLYRRKFFIPKSVVVYYGRK